MAGKSDFTEEEWEQLRRGVTGAGLLVATSDRSLFASGQLRTRTPAEVYRAVQLDNVSLAVAHERVGTAAEYLVAATPHSQQRVGGEDRCQLHEVSGAERPLTADAHRDEPVVEMKEALARHVADDLRGD